MIGALTMSILFCIFLYSKHRQSLEQISKLMNEFEQLSTSDEVGSSLLSQLKNKLSRSNSHCCDTDGASLKKNSSSSKLSLFNLKRKSMSMEQNITNSKALNEKHGSFIKEFNVTQIFLFNINYHKTDNIKIECSVRS